MSTVKLISAALALPNAFAEAQTDFAIAIEGNRIVATGPRATLQQQYPTASSEHFANAVLLPSLVNSHDHGRGLGTASLGIDDDILEAWLLTLRVQPSISPYLAAALDGVRLLHSGVTLTAHSANPLDWRNLPAEAADTLRGYRDAGIRVAYHPPMVDQNPLVYFDEDRFIASLPTDLQPVARKMRGYAAITQDEYIALCDALYAQFHDNDQHIAHIQISPAGGQWCSDGLIMRSVEWAKAHHTRIQMHMLETRFQRQYARRKWGKSFIMHLDEIGALGPWLTLAHMIWSEPDDLPVLAARGVAIAHNPGSNLRLRSGIAPLAEMHAAGIPLGIGLDGHALDDDQDYLREMRLAHTLSNLRIQQQNAAATLTSARTILHLGSRSGAQVTLGTAAPLGYLESGALADCVLLDLDFSVWDYAAHTAGLVEAIIHLASRRHVSHVMVNGEWVIRDHQHLHLSESELLQQIKAELQRQTQPQLNPVLRDAAAIATRLKAFYEADAAV